MLAWMAIVISLASFAASVVFARRAQDFDRQTHDFAKNQFKISREREIFEWAAKTLEIFPELKSGDENRIKVARNRLSAQIDIGRLLFPNDQVETVGVHKPEERRGRRSRVLDPLISIHRQLPTSGPESEMDDLQRKFIHYVGKNFTPVVTDSSAESLARAEYLETKENGK